jgi:uncharacterized protein (DUF1330 family)
MAVTYVLIARVPAAGVEAFQRYEAAVLPLLADHGGRLDRRLRSADGTVEVHVIAFGEAGDLAAYRADSRREQHAHALAESGAQVELLQMQDVPTA